MDMLGRTWRLQSRKKLERKISRKTGLSRYPVAKWLHGWMTPSANGPA